MFGFLQNCSNFGFHEELQALGHDLPVPACLWDNHDDGLQTDGNRCSSHLVLEGQGTGRHRPRLFCLAVTRDMQGTFMLGGTCGRRPRSQVCVAELCLYMTPLGDQALLRFPLEPLSFLLRTLAVEQLTLVLSCALWGSEVF